MTDWDRRFIDLSYHISDWSKDPSTKVGCVMVGGNREILATGFNGFPRGIDDDERLYDRTKKYPIICHGEENAMLDAARRGVSLLGATAYVTPFASCSRCARGLIQVGVWRVVYPDTTPPDRWLEEIELSTSLFKEAGVEMSFVKVIER